MYETVSLYEAFSVSFRPQAHTYTIKIMTTHRDVRRQLPDGPIRSLLPDGAISFWRENKLIWRRTVRAVSCVICYKRKI